VYVCAEKNVTKMIVQMEDDLLELYMTGKSVRYKNISRNRTLLEGFVLAVKLMERVETVGELRQISRLHYEQLKYQYSGLSSVRLSNRYVHRLLFEEIEGGVIVRLIDIDDTHYGNKR